MLRRAVNPLGIGVGGRRAVEAKKTLHLLLVGELFGLHTMRQILQANGLKSNNWSKVCKSLSYKKISLFVNHALLHALRTRLVELGSKSASTWSRAEVTIVLDDSIFKQWLSNEPIGEHFAKYFSGQVGKAVYGFRVTLCGVSIADTFYPAHLELTPKSADSRQTACRLLKELHGFIAKLAASKGLLAPNLFVSADSGFDGPALLDTCASLGEGLPLTPICVPKKSNLIKCGDFKGKLSDFIEKEFLPQEAAHIKQYAEKKQQPPPFTLRIKANYVSRKQQMVFLFFRLRGSKKVSVIYSTDLSAKAKTLRRHWFQRTLIEQFFRFLKDTLKIQQAKNTDKEGFERKLLVFVFKALQCQLFRNFCRKRFRPLKGWAFSKIRQRIAFDGIEKQMLADLLLHPD